MGEEAKNSRTITKGEKERELSDLENVIKDNNIDTIITGAIASEDQKKRVDDIGKKFNIKDYSPLWGIDPLSELKELSNSFNAIIKI